MHSEFARWCKEKKGSEAAEILQEENISIHAPRKDQCDVCCSYDLGQLSEDKYLEHIERKTKAREEKNQLALEAKTNSHHARRP